MVTLWASHAEPASPTKASAATNVSPERFEDVRIVPNTLVAGNNVIAVEVHRPTRGYPIRRSS